jgi:hypothetical protein
MKNFDYWKKQYDSQKLEEFNSDQSGLLWLKIKAISKVEFLKEFIKETKIVLKEKTVAKQFNEIYIILVENLEESHLILDRFLRKIDAKQVAESDTVHLLSELYKLKTFEWGGDRQNSLDRHLVDNYVKVHKSYDELISKLNTEINNAVKGYLLNSWFNHWTSILIECVFKKHFSVLPTIAQVKSVDFFINNIPFDLKVTILPVGYIKEKRKEKGYPVELTFLKQKAKKAEISFNKNKKAKAIDVINEIIESMKAKGDQFCLNVLTEINDQKKIILNEAQQNPKILATWLYENQGDMRFGSENRLFLILADTEDFNNSWKLKSNLELLEPAIKNYLDNFDSENVNDLQVSFKWKSKTFNALTDIIFVVK